jgi:hypothetical protein
MNKRNNNKFDVLIGQQDGNEARRIVPPAVGKTRMLVDPVIYGFLNEQEINVPFELKKIRMLLGIKSTAEIAQREERSKYTRMCNVVRELRRGGFIQEFSHSNSGKQYVVLNHPGEWQT